jgi:glutamate 5-kinase
LASIGQKYLMKQYLDILWDNKLVWEILIDDYADEKHLSKTIKNLLKNDVWIIINHNDTLHPDELNNVSEKSDNDKNTVFIAKIFNKYLDIEIKRVIYLTNSNWLLDKEKNTVLGWKISSENDKNYYMNFVEKDKSNSWTGWMESKLDCSFKVLEYWIWEAIISNAKNWLECLVENSDNSRFWK